MNNDDVLEKAAAAYLGKDLGRNLGPLLLAAMFDLILFGALSHQIIVWSSHAHIDRLSVKIIVIWSIVVTVATTGYGFYFVWTYFVDNFGVFRVWLNFNKLLWYPVLAVAATIPSQIFYTERAYRLLQKRWWVAVSVGPFVVASLVGALVIRIKGRSSFNLNTNDTSRIFFYLWIGSTLVADLLVTGYILYGLSKAKTGWAGSDNIVNRLYKITLESQLPPTWLAIAFMIHYGLHAESTMNGLFFVHSKVYTVCLMATLNSRMTLKQDINSSGKTLSEPQTNSYPLSERYQQPTVPMQIGTQ